MITEDQKAYIKQKIKEEGVEYTLLYYSKWDEIKDTRFHELLSNYKQSITDITSYISQ